MKQRETFIYFLASSTINTSRLRVPEIPVIAMFDIPVLADGLAVSVRVLVKAAGFLLNDAVTPFGNPVAYKFTF